MVLVGMVGGGFNKIVVVIEVDGGGWRWCWMGKNYLRQRRGNSSAIKIDGITFSFIGWFNTARDSPVLNLV
jgi:hypothetical protein